MTISDMTISEEHFNQNKVTRVTMGQDRLVIKYKKGVDEKYILETRKFALLCYEDYLKKQGLPSMRGVFEDGTLRLGSERSDIELEYEFVEI